MPDEPPKPDDPAAATMPPGEETAGPETDEARRERIGISDFVRRAVSAGIGAASRGKDDFVRVAATEMRSWLDHLDLDEEIVKALSRMVIEVKTEIRFRQTDDGKLVPQAENDVKVKPAK